METNSPFFWLGVNLLCIFVQGFFSMMEMACISFNRVRLQYYLTKSNKKASYINFLVRRPYRLFGTVMLGVNIALQIGSESSRTCYKLLGISPEYAPATQIILVVIFAELIPLAISRKIPEKIALKGAPILYFAHYLFYPLIQCVGGITNMIYFILNIKEETLHSTLSRDELQKTLETHHEEHDFNVIATNIFSLSATSVEQVCQYLDQIPILSATASVRDICQLVRRHRLDFVPVYHKVKKNVVGIAFPKNLINRNPSDPVVPYLSSPWFITAKSKLIHAIQEFRKNSSNVAIVLNNNGEPMGVLGLHTVFKTLFNTRNIAQLKPKPTSLIERTFSGNTPLSEIENELDIIFMDNDCTTIEQLMLKLLDTPPEVGASIIINDLLLEVKEISLYGIKTVAIKDTL
ncbi:CNNM domain-containing protein [Chlamydia trachomatis]|uniref:CNNM domain-containing protein n=1 Tax=Chlamydia trachomatis TaxID=813 RepID=UPI0039BDB815